MPWVSLIILCGVALLIPTAYAAKIGAPYAPTRRAIVRKSFDLLKLTADDVIVDLGAGDGSILLDAEKHGARATGYELSPILWLVAKLRTLGKDKIKLLYSNFYKASLTDATIVFAFLMPNNMGRVKKYLSQQHIPNARYFLAYAFPLPDTDPIQIIREKNCAPLYVYDLPELTKLKE